MIVTIEKYKYYEKKSFVFFMEYIKMNEVIDEYSSLLPFGISLSKLIIRNKSIDIRYSKKNINSTSVVIRNGLYLPSDKNCKVEIGLYNTILEKNGDLIDEFFEIDEGLKLSELL